MTYADDMRAPLLKAAADADETARLLIKVGEAIKELADTLNRARQLTGRAGRTLFDANVKQQEALNGAREALRGSEVTRLGVEGMQFLLRNETDTSDNTTKLLHIDQQLETILRDIMPVLTETNGTTIGRAKSAASHFRGYAADL